MSYVSAAGRPQAAAGLDRRAFVCALAGVVALALWTRLAVWRQVFVGGEILTRDPDADYHLLRIARTVEHFPRVPSFDPQLNWPDGAACPWAPGFDAMGALFSLLLGAGRDPGAVERAAAFYPVALGVALVVGTVLFARRVLPAGLGADASALLAGLLLAVLPRAVSASSLGRVDHHVFEALAYLLLGGWALRAVAAQRDGRALALGFELQGALLIALAGSGFTGSILYASIAAAILIATQLAAGESARAPWFGSGAVAFASAAALLLLLYAPATTTHGQVWDFRLASLLQPALHAALALACALAATVARTGRRTRAGGCQASVGVASVGLGGALRLAGWLALAGATLWPWLGEQSWRGMLDWIGTQDPWLASIDEFQPLVRPGEWGALLDFNGFVGLLLPVVVPVALWQLARRDRAIAAAFGFWLLAVLPLALLRSRFATPLTPAFAICVAVALLALARALARWGVPARAPWLATLLAWALLVADPASRAMLLLREPRGPSAIESVSLALRELPSPASGPGALARWSHGHTLLRLAGRPVLAAGFGHWTGAAAFRASETYMRGDLPQLMQLMEERQLGFVIAGMSAPFPERGDRPGDPRKPFVLPGERVIWNAPYFRARPLTPLIVGGSGDPELEIPHIPTLMPQFAAEQGAEGMGFPLQRLWLYERVKGARLLGRAPPGARVVVEIPLRVWGRTTSYRAWTQAHADGGFELMLPVPTGRRGEALATGPRATLSVAGRRIASLRVREADVREGRRIDVEAAPEAVAAR